VRNLRWGYRVALLERCSGALGTQREGKGAQEYAMTRADWRENAHEIAYRVVEVAWSAGDSKLTRQ